MRRFYLVTVFGFAAVLFLSPAAKASQARSDFADQAFTRVNDERTQAGLAPLKRLRTVELAAQMHAMDMANREYMAHPTKAGGSPVTPDPAGYPNIKFTGGVQPDERLAVCGLQSPGAWGENVAYNFGQGANSPANALTTWMQSEPHRENILSANFTGAGMGVAVSAGGKVYYAQLFVAAAGSNPTLSTNAGLWQNTPPPPVGPPDTAAPTGWRGFETRRKMGKAAFEVRVRDTGSGLKPASGAYRYSEDDGVTWSAWFPAAVEGAPGATAEQTLATPLIALDSQSRTNQVQFRIEDVAGNMGVSPVYPVPRKRRGD